MSGKSYFDIVTREYLSEETNKAKNRRIRGISKARSVRKNVPGRRNSFCNGPERGNT